MRDRLQRLKGKNHHGYGLVLEGQPREYHSAMIGSSLGTSKHFRESAALSCHMAELQMESSRLPLIPWQSTIFLLRGSFSHYKLLYLLRCTPCAGHLLLEVFDIVMSKIQNIKFSDSQWLQVMLQIRTETLESVGCPYLQFSPFWLLLWVPAFPVLHA